MVRIDVERVAGERLADLVGIQAVLEIPEKRPEEFISVELLGGSGGRFRREVSLAVQSWAATRKRAAEIAQAVEDAVPSLADEPNIFTAVADGTYRWPDPESHQERYQTNVELSICE